MRKPRRPRTLTEGEARLWGEIAKLITPLRGRAKRGPTTAAPEKASQQTIEKEKVSRAAEHPAPPRPKPVAAAPKPAPVLPAARPGQRPLKLGDLHPSVAVPKPSPPAVAAAKPARTAPSGLERREHRGLKRGLLPIEARIDLHGLYQAEAHAALVGFLMRSRAAGHARVLVVTGKGGEGARDPFSERGVLRRSVPHWLRGPDLQSVVVGFEEAARHHGGAGALYVRLRRR